MGDLAASGFPLTSSSPLLIRPAILVHNAFYRLGEALCISNKCERGSLRQEF